MNTQNNKTNDISPEQKKDQDNRIKLFKDDLRYTNNLIPSSLEFQKAPLIKLHHDELKQNKAELKRKIKEIMGTDSDDKKKRLTILIMQYYAPKVSKLYELNQGTAYELMENQKDRSGNLFIDNLVESSLEYLDNNIDNYFKNNTTVTNYKDIKPEKLGDTLSRYFWKYDKKPIVRHKCLLDSLENCVLDKGLDEGLAKVNSALLFVGRMHKAHPDVVSACNEDLNWIKENWDKGDNIKKIIEIRKKKKEENKSLAPINKNPIKRKINPPSSKSKKNIDNISIMTNPKTIRRFFKNYNQNNPCKVKMKAIDFIEYSSGRGLKEIYQKDDFDKKRIIEKSLSQSKIKNASYINENGEDYIVIIQ